MGRLLSLVRGIETSLWSRLGKWAQEVSLSGDQASSDISTLQVDVNAAEADIVQLQADVTAPGSAYVTQTEWYVDSVAGNDANNGLTALTAIQTLAELERRWTGRTFSPVIATVNIHLAGTFQTEALTLDATFTTPTNTPTVNVIGTMTEVDSGAIGAFQAWNSAADLRAQLTDGAQDFTAHVRRRVRLTSGTGLGAITWIGSLGGGVTIANVGQFRTGTGFTGANKTPAPGDTYVIETFDTQIKEYHFNCRGALVFLQDVEVAPSVASVIGACSTADMQQPRVKLFGVGFTNPAGGQIQVVGAQTWLACSVKGANFQYTHGFLNTKGFCAFGSVAFFAAMVQSDSSMHDGNGTDAAHMLIEQSATVFDSTFRAFFGNTNASQTSLVRMNNFGCWSLNSAYFWGAAGNLKTNALWVGNSSGVVYSAATVPKATGATPGENDVVVSNVGAAWAALPILAASPDNGYVNVKYN